ncbi:MAG: gliding motility lipoprotein GldJ [Crocinitomicaceae bacterium]|nr:gliding motility lipoprotein GldJ [Crocinitomicaceae bacterium]|tara:strand:+ start:2777 stop:4525 length:1749 start_codon:yes stop_codon:yes gene_type:complete
MKLKLHITLIASLGIMFALTGCYRERSGATGWKYNKTENGGFEKANFYEQQTGPGLIFVEGGTFTMGQVEDDLTNNWDNSPRRVTVSSFYMDETEVTNMFWLEYLNWLDRIYGNSFPEIVERALPDTLAWREKLAYNEPMVDYYLRHPAYRDYPVVGVSWRQATDFCKWRTDRVNENILVQEGLFVHNPESQMDEEHFTTDTYLNRQYVGERDAEGIKDYSPNSSGYRDIRMEDGVLLPDYRLPTEAEWEYAALGLIGNSYGELIEERRTYPWDGHYIRNDKTRDKGFGDINANFVKGRGDYMGVAGALDDFGDITVQVRAYAPNDYGLFNMAGNVNEWVMDVYRPLSTLDSEEFRPYRGNNYQTMVHNPEGNPADKYDYVVYDIPGTTAFLNDYRRKIGSKAVTPEDDELMNSLEVKFEEASEADKKKQEEEAQTIMADAMDMIEESEALVAADLRKGMSDNIIAVPGDMKFRDVTVEENINRSNYREANNIDYLDGDFNSSIAFGQGDEGRQDMNRMYDYGASSLVNNQSRVYKGGGWNDRAYWLVPGTRRFLDETQSSADIGFRCAMTRVGTPVPYSGH